MLNVNSHPLLQRLHKPERHRVTKQVLPLEQQDKRGEAHIEPEAWLRWLQCGHDEAKMMLVAPPAEFYDQNDALSTDALLRDIDSEAAAQVSLLGMTPGDG